jgi:hypothetical protein
MAGKYVFTVPGETVNLVLSDTGTFPPATGDFDIAVGTANTPLNAPNYEGFARALNGQLVSNFLESDNLTLFEGNFQVKDFGESDSIVAGSGNQTIVGGAFSSIVGGTGDLNAIAGDRGLVAVGSAASATVNALVDSDTVAQGERVDLGGNNATVFASGDDTVNAGAGLGAVLYFHGGGDTVLSSLTVQGAAAELTYTVSGGGGDSLVGGAQSVSMILSDGETVDIGAGVATVNALSGDQGIRLDGANATVYADAGDQVFGGAGEDLILFFHGAGDSVTSTVLLEGSAAGSTLTVTGADGDSLAGAADSVNVVGAAGDSIQVGGAGAATVNALSGAQLVLLGDNAATVYAGIAASDGDTLVSADTVFAGEGGGVISLGETNTSFLSVSGAGGGSYNLESSERELFGTADAVNLVSLANETIGAGSVSQITINAAAGDFSQLINLGSGSATVYADAGDTINAGTGPAVIVMEGGQNATVTGPLSTVNAAIITGTDTVFAAAGKATILGAPADTIIAGTGGQLINAVSGASLGELIVVSEGSDTVFAGDSDTVAVGLGPGLAGGTTVGGNLLVLDSSVAGGADSVGYGTILNDTTGTASAVQVTVGTVAGGVASEIFDIADDFLFYPNADAGTNALIVAGAQATLVDGTASAVLTFPDGTEMTLVGVDLASLGSVVFKAA